MNLTKKQSRVFTGSRIIIALCLAAAFLSMITIKAPRIVHAAPFTPGNLVVVRVGTGAAALNNNSTAVFLDEYTTAAGQVAPVQTIALPVADGGANQTLTMTGNSTSEGFLRVSTNGQYLTMAGYDVAPGTASVSTTASGTVNRVVGRVDINGAIDTTTVIPDGYDQSNIRAAISDDGTKFWTSGTSTTTGGLANSGGTRFIVLSAATSNQVSTTPAGPNNARVIGIFNGQLYVSSASSPFVGLNRVGTGIPTTGGQTTTNVANTTTSGTGTPSPYDYIFYGTSVLYVADDRSAANGGGIQKWTSSDGGITFTLQYTMNLAGAVRGLTGYTDTSGNAVLFATNTTNPNSIVKVSDPLAQTVLGVQPAFTTVATAPANTAFRGIAPAFVRPTASDARVTGRVTNSSGAPVAGVVVRLNGMQNRKTITDADGYYHFDEVETNGFYTVTPSSATFTFSPTERSFSQLGNTTSAVFTGTPIANSGNPLDTPEYFVRQHYLDFLSREPDESGFNFWSDQILACGNDAACIERRTVNVSAAYFLSVEFQQTGGLVDRLYKASYARSPRYAEFMPDTAAIARDVVVGRSGWEAILASNKEAFVSGWVDRAAFHAAFDNLSNDTYVDTLFQNTGANFTPGERDSLVSGLSDGTLSRARVLEQIANSANFARARFNGAFVMMEYFGYLRRDPDAGGYQFWLDKLNQFDGNFERADMVKAFIDSGEYRARFER